MLSSALFDLDGLLVDTEIITLRIYRDLVGQYGHDMSRATYAERYSGHNDKDNMRSIIDRYRLPITMEEGLAFVFQSEAAYLREGGRPQARRARAFVVAFRTWFRDSARLGKRPRTGAYASRAARHRPLFLSICI